MQKKIKIVKSEKYNYWYADLIGHTFDVLNEEILSDGLNYRVQHGYEKYILASDAEEIVEIVETAKQRTYEYKGKKYDLPEWAKFVTCDGDGSLLFAWEHKPTPADTIIKNRVNFFCATGARTILKETPKPLPEGAFIVEV